MLAERMTVKENFSSPRLNRKAYPPSILLISDNPVQASKTECFLIENGCRVCRIDLKADFLATTCQHYSEMILLDVQTPETSLRAWQKIEANSELSTMPVILLTGDGCSEEAARQLKTGHIYCLPHNATDDRLLTLVQQISYMFKRYV